MLRHCKITVIHSYIPTTVSSDEDIKAFYSILEDALAKIHKKDIIIITGDWNAKIGSDNTDWKSVMGDTDTVTGTKEENVS